MLQSSLKQSQFCKIFMLSFKELKDTIFREIIKVRKVLLERMLTYHQDFLQVSRIRISTIPFFSPVEDSPASDIPLVDDAARMEVAENALLVFRCHNPKHLKIKVIKKWQIRI